MPRFVPLARELEKLYKAALEGNHNKLNDIAEFMRESASQGYAFVSFKLPDLDRKVGKVLFEEWLAKNQLGYAFKTREEGGNYAEKGCDVEYLIVRIATSEQGRENQFVAW